MDSTTKVHLTRETLSMLVHNAFGDGTEIYEFEELTQGWYNTAYAITLSSGHRTVIKVSPPDDAAILSYEHDIMRTEVEVMRLVEPNPNIPVPHISASDLSQSLIPNNYYFMDYIQGDVWNDIAKDLTEAQNREISHQLGQLTAHINSYHNHTFGYYALEPKFSSWMEAVRVMFTMLFQDADTFDIDLPIGLAEVDTWLTLHQRTFSEITLPRLVHWDLWQGNVFVDMEGNGNVPTICGLIDFERVYWGDPLGEAFFRKGGNTAFIQGYGQPMLATESQRTRNLFYDLYLYIIMIVEDGPRQYSDRGVVNWARGQLVDTLTQIREVV